MLARGEPFAVSRSRDDRGATLIRIGRLGVATAAAVEFEDTISGCELPGDGNGFENKWRAGDDTLAWRNEGTEKGAIGCSVALPVDSRPACLLDRFANVTLASICFLKPFEFVLRLAVFVG